MPQESTILRPYLYMRIATQGNNNHIKTTVAPATLIDQTPETLAFSLNEAGQPPRHHVVPREHLFHDAVAYRTEHVSGNLDDGFYCECVVPYALESQIKSAMRYAMSRALNRAIAQQEVHPTVSAYRKLCHALQQEDHISNA